MKCVYKKEVRKRKVEREMHQQTVTSLPMLMEGKAQSAAGQNSGLVFATSSNHSCLCHREVGWKREDKKANRTQRVMNEHHFLL